MDSKLCMMKRIYCQVIVTTSKITGTNPGLNIKLGHRVKVSENGICYKQWKMFLQEVVVRLHHTNITNCWFFFLDTIIFHQKDPHVLLKMLH